jgi:hypothetical protein
MYLYIYVYIYICLYMQLQQPHESSRNDDAETVEQIMFPILFMAI